MLDSPMVLSYAELVLLSFKLLQSWNNQNFSVSSKQDQKQIKTTAFLTRFLVLYKSVFALPTL